MRHSQNIVSGCHERRKVSLIGESPAGEAAQSASERLGIFGIRNLRIGKLIEFEIKAINEDEARKDIEVLAEKLLANPVIENWTYELTLLEPKVI